MPVRGLRGLARWKAKETRLRQNNQAKNMLTIRKAAVIGAGNMGAQIAAHLGVTHAALSLTHSTTQAMASVVLEAGSGPGGSAIL